MTPRSNNTGGLALFSLQARGLQQLHLPLALLIAGLLCMVWISGSLSFFRAELDGISGGYANRYVQSYGQVQSSGQPDSAAASISSVTPRPLVSQPPTLASTLASTLSVTQPRSVTQPLSAAQPQPVLQSQQFQHAIRYLQQHAATAPRWYIEFPTARQPFLLVRWQAATGKPSAPPFAARAPLQRQMLDPISGQPVTSDLQTGRQTGKQTGQPASEHQSPAELAMALDPDAMALGTLFFQLHYQAHGWLGPYGGKVIAALSVLYVLLAVGGVVQWRRRVSRYPLSIPLKSFTLSTSAAPMNAQTHWRLWHRRLAMVTLPFCVMWLGTGVATLMFAFNSAPIAMLYNPAVSVITNSSASQGGHSRSDHSGSDHSRSSSADFYQQLFPATSMQFAGAAALKHATPVATQHVMHPLTVLSLDDQNPEWPRLWSHIPASWQAPDPRFHGGASSFSHLLMDNSAPTNTSLRHNAPATWGVQMHKVTIDRPSAWDATLLFTAWPQQLWQHQHSVLVRWSDAALLAQTDPRGGPWQTLRARLLSLHQAQIWPLWVNAILATFGLAACAMLYCGMRLWYQQFISSNTSQRWQHRLAWAWVCLSCHGFGVAAVLLIVLSQSPLWAWLLQQGCRADMLMMTLWGSVSLALACRPPARLS